MTDYMKSLNTSTTKLRLEEEIDRTAIGHLTISLVIK